MSAMCELTPTLLDACLCAPATMWSARAISRPPSLTPSTSPSLAHLAVRMSRRRAPWTATTFAGRVKLTAAVHSIAAERPQSQTRSRPPCASALSTFLAHHRCTAASAMGGRQSSVTTARASLPAIPRTSRHHHLPCRAFQSFGCCRGRRSCPAADRRRHRQLALMAGPP